MTNELAAQKSTAAAWFRTLRDEIVAAFEAVEDRQKSDAPAGRFDVTETKRASDDGLDAGGGLMWVMRTRWSVACRILLAIEMTTP